MDGPHIESVIIRTIKDEFVRHVVFSQLIDLRSAIT